MFGRV